MSASHNQFQPFSLNGRTFQSLICREQLELITQVVDKPQITITSRRIETFERRILISGQGNFRTLDPEPCKLKGGRNNRKKRKEKIPQRRNETVQNLRDVLEQIYTNPDGFDLHKSNIYSLIESIPDKNKFKELLNYLINDLIEVLFKQLKDAKEDIWEMVEDKIQQYHTNDSKPKDCSEWPQFYSYLIDVMYKKLLEIKSSTRDIERIIKVYNAHYGIRENSRQKDFHSDLFRNTFMLLINNDRLLKKFMKCSRIFSRYTHNIQPMNKQTYRKLEEMIHVLKPRDSEDQQDDDNQDQCILQADSASNASTDACPDEKTTKPKKKKKKKNKKNNTCKQDNPQGQPQTGIQIQEEQADAQFVQWFKTIEIGQRRLVSTWDATWLRSLEHRLSTVQFEL